MELEKSGREVIIGILALQGAFAEHHSTLQRLSLKRKISVILVRTLEDLQKCDALVIPGGESTTIALLAQLAGLLEPLREFLRTRPVWGTCAGAILLARAVEGAKKGGQELLGGMSVTIARNGWGSQVESFEAPLEIDGLRDPDRPFTGVFIRAPVLLSLSPSQDDPPIEVIARLPPSLLQHSQVLVPSAAGSADQTDNSPTTIVFTNISFGTVSSQQSRNARFRQLSSSISITIYVKGPNDIEIDIHRPTILPNIYTGSPAL